MQIMNKQTIFLASFALAIMLLAMPLVFAEENETQEIAINEADENQTLDSIAIEELDESLNESVSSWDITRKRFDIWFTSKPEEKAKKELDLARMRLIQARVAAKNGNTNAMESALLSHEKNLERVRTIIDSIDGSSNANETKKSFENLVGIERAIQVHELRINRLKELVSNESNLTEHEVIAIQNQISRAENNTAHLKGVQDTKMERVKTKLMAVGNLSEEEVESEIEEIENSQSFKRERAKQNKGIRE